MVCMDGFILTHAVERVDVPAQGDVDAFLPPFAPRQVLDPDAPLTIGAMVGPEAFAEVRYLMHAKQMQALDAIPEIAGEFEDRFGRASGGLVRGYRAEDAETVVVALGSVLGTLEDVVDALRERGERVGALAVRCFRPWPMEEVRTALGHAKRVIVLEKSFAVGIGGIVGQNVRLALDGLGVRVHDVIAGLGGRAITAASLRAMLEDGLANRLGPLTFLDMDWGLVSRELERPSGPHAENMLRDLAGRL
jgi:pyruvate ferredoxin oxidoreductase alpha subunit